MRKAFFLLVANLLMAIAGRAQVHNSLTLSVRNAPVKKVIDLIENQSRYKFFFNENCLGHAKPVSVTVTNATIETTLDICFRDQPITYVINDHAIILKMKPVVESEINGRVTGTEGEVVANATVHVKGTNRSIRTDSTGNFSIKVPAGNDVLLVSSVGYKTTEFTINGNLKPLIALGKYEEQLQEILVVTNGFQTMNRNRVPGSFVKIDNRLYNRSITFNALDRIDGVTSGLIFNKNIPGGSNQSGISIRGVSTINANSNPLVVVDNFIYEGDINNINPNDIESITIAKDAAAASMWGAYSGNGVIIVTTKKGKYEQPVKVSATSNITVGSKPDLYYTPRLSSGDYISIERFLFDQGFYDITLNLKYQAVSPVVEILDLHKRGLLSTGEMEFRLNTLSNTDVRDEMMRYFYTNPVHQQYAINLSGGNKNIRNYFSVGYDNNPGYLKKNQYDRITVTGNNSYRLLENDNLELTTGLVFTHTRSTINNSVNLGSYYPYLKLADDNGNALAIPNIMNSLYTDTAGAGQLLDWKYRPLDELNIADNKTRQTHYRVTLGAHYKIIPSLELHINYQYINETYEGDNYQSIESFYTRDLVNRFTQINSQTNEITRPVPAGGIFDRRRFTNNAHNIRAQLNYATTWKEDHEFRAIAGAEKRTVKTQTTGDRLYNYNKTLQTSVDVDYFDLFPLYHAPFRSEKIPDEKFSLGTTDYYLSYFTNLTYVYKQRYSLYASARIDQSNLFGVNTNQKSAPLWSAGASWEISQDVAINWLSYLRLRTSFGYTGNVDKTLSAYAAIRYGNNNNPFNELQAILVNPPNNFLKWEKISIANMALDFATYDNRLTGSIEYYIKKGMDLIGFSPIDPTTGVSQYKGNTANIKGSGYEITLNATLLKKEITWLSTLLVNHAVDKVTHYEGGAKTVEDYTTTPFLNPLEGYPLYSLFSYKWGGLDANGDPLGYIDGHTTKDYSEIIASSDFKDLVFNGSATPTTFGSWRNTFLWKQFELSLNIKYKLGYYFRRNSINYASLVLSKGDPGHQDYLNRWQQPGDEYRTNIPALVYPLNADRESFYNFSEILAEKGDHIRLQDILLAYTLNKPKIMNLELSSIRFGFYANNIGIIWKATKTGIDPDYTIVNFPAPITFSTFLTINF